MKSIIVIGSVQAFRVEEEKFYVQQLSNSRNTQYFGKTEIGGQEVKAIFDTGSFETLVMGTRCETCTNQPYDHTLSSHYHKSEEDKLYRHEFGSGPTVSVMAFDSIEVGPFKVNDHMIWEILEHNIKALDYSKFHAIVGIGPKFAPNAEDEKTLLMKFGIDEFSVCLEKPSPSPQCKHGESYFPTRKACDYNPGWLMWGKAPETSAYYLAKNLWKDTEVIGELHWAVKMQTLRYISNMLY